MTPFVVLYRWRIADGQEEAFIAAWTAITRRLRETAGSRGSRLHRGDDGLWYAYAVWPDEVTRARAFETADRDADDAWRQSREAMQDAVIERLPEVRLDLVSDEWLDAPTIPV